jgi:molybdopterin converting factor small subunit
LHSLKHFASLEQMIVTVAYTAQLKAALDTAAEDIEIEPPVKVRDVLDVLRTRHAAAFESLVVDDQGRLLPSILLCLGDEQVAVDHPDELSDGDTLTLLTAISGG